MSQWIRAVIQSIQKPSKWNYIESSGGETLGSKVERASVISNYDQRPRILLTFLYNWRWEGDMRSISFIILAIKENLSSSSSHSSHMSRWFYSLSLIDLTENLINPLNSGMTFSMVTSSTSISRIGLTRCVKPRFISLSAGSEIITSQRLHTGGEQVWILSSWLVLSVLTPDLSKQQW